MAKKTPMITETTYGGGLFDEEVETKNAPTSGPGEAHCEADLALLHAGRRLAGDQLESKRPLARQSVRARSSVSNTTITGQQQVDQQSAVDEKVKQKLRRSG